MVESNLIRVLVTLCTRAILYLARCSYFWNPGGGCRQSARRRTPQHVPAHARSLRSASSDRASQYAAATMSLRNLGSIMSELRAKAHEAGSALQDAQRRISQQALEAAGVAEKTEIAEDVSELQTHAKLEVALRKLFSLNGEAHARGSVQCPMHRLRSGFSSSPGFRGAVDACSCAAGAPHTTTPARARVFIGCERC